LDPIVFSHVAQEFTTLNLLKSIFISGFIMWLAVVSIYAITQVARGTEPLLSWLGLALSAISPLAFFIKVFVAKSARTPRHPVEYSVLAGLGLAITMTISYRFGHAAGLIHVWAAVTLILWLIYLRWYSVFHDRDSQSLKVGASLPEFPLESLEGHSVSSESFKARPHLLIFYRGNWCPFCTAQIEELVLDYQRLEDLGVSVVLISSQSLKKNQALATRFDVPMIFLRDKDNTAAKQLGIFHKWGTPMGIQMLGYDSDTVLPTVILTNPEGQIIYTDQTDNYRVRPEPETFEAIFRKSGVVS
jgi:peroxiredoxin